MGKYELTTLDNDGKVKKTFSRGWVSTALFVKYKRYAEELTADNKKTDADLIEDIKPLVLETFPELTAAEYDNEVDPSSVFALFRAVNTKALEILKN